MASIAFPTIGSQPILRDQPAPAPAEAGGPQAVDPNQQDAPQGDTVTISATFPPPQPAQQSATVTVEQFSLFLNQTEGQTGQAATPPTATTAAPTTTPGAPAAAATAQANAQATTVGTPASATAVDPATAAADATTDAATTQAGAPSNPQQELAQLDQTLQQLGINPQSISLFNRMGLLLYANDPTALQNLVQALQAVDQQINQLGAGADAAAQAQGPVQNELSAAAQGQAQASQANAQVTPEALTPGEVSTLAQAVAAPQTQSQTQTENQAVNTGGATTVAAQLSFSDIQASFQEQSTAAQGSTANPPAPTNTTGAASPQTNSLLVNFQELQLSFQAVEVQSPQQQTNGANNSATPGQAQTLDINA